jgi:hypothetical protein
MRYYDTQKFKKDLVARILEVCDTYKKGNYKSLLSHFKNVDLDLDLLKTETQSIGQFLENLDKRLSKFEAQGNNDNRPSVKTLSQSIGRSTIYSFIEGYLKANGKTFPGLKLPLELAREIFTAIRADKSLSINILPSEFIVRYISNWEDQPF